jgi:hypothetical protein
MFEELNNQTAPTPTSQPTDNPPVAPASTPALSADQASDGHVQDIFASVESPTASQPVGSSSQPFAQPFMPAGIPSSSQPVSQAIPKSGVNAKVVLIILVVLILAGAGALAYLQYFKKTPPQIIVPEAINTVSELPATTTEVGATAIDEVIITPTSTDNQTSTEPGTSDITEPISSVEVEPSVVVDNPIPEANPNLDSDQDGLTDAEELNIYQTNPLQADSDGDGYTDGDEVRAGYNPLGEGKLAQ